MDHVILVDAEDNALGTMEKMEAHRKGLLHRAFSVVLLNSKGEVLLQKRASSKYHSGGLWTNTCCSHPLPGESLSHATQRKLQQEMGICPPIEPAFKFIYRVELEKDLVEHEFDHVFAGTFDGEPRINKDEVDDWKFVNLAQLRQDTLENPDRYTHWFRIIINHPGLDGLIA